MAVNLTSQTTYSYWNPCSSLEIVGPYGNRVFRTLSLGTTYIFSLFAPVDKQDSWQWTTNYQVNWNTVAVNGWTESTTEILPETTQITHYFRKTISGKNDLSAYEFQFWYKHGIVAYLNGMEIYRDNIATGVVTPNTQGGTAYAEYAFRGAIRNGFELVQQRVLAVEVHTQGESESLSFDGWLAGYVDSSSVTIELNCHPIPLTSLFNENNVNDMVFGDLDLCTAFLKPMTVGTSYFTYETVTAAQITSWFFNQDVHYAIKQFKVRQQDLTADSWGDYVHSGPFPYTADGLYQRVDIGDAYQRSTSRRFQFHPTVISSPSVALADLLPVVCNRPFSLDRKAFEWPANVTMEIGKEVKVEGADTASGFECSILPTLPKGVELVNCGLQGTPSESMEETRFTVFYDDFAGTRSKEVVMRVAGKNGEKPTDAPEENKLSFLIGMMLMGSILVVILLVVLCCVCCCHRPSKQASSKKLPVQKRPRVVDNSFTPSSVRIPDTMTMSNGRDIPCNSMSFTINLVDPPISNSSSSQIPLDSTNSTMTYGNGGGILGSKVIEMNQLRNNEVPQELSDSVSVYSVGATTAISATTATSTATGIIFDDSMSNVSAVDDSIILMSSPTTTNNDNDNNDTSSIILTDPPAELIQSTGSNGSNGLNESSSIIITDSEPSSNATPLSASIATPQNNFPSLSSPLRTPVNARKQSLAELTPPICSPPPPFRSV